MTEQKIDGLETIHGARILLVEDNSINQEIAMELLRKEKFLVDVADNGQIALEKIKTAIQNEMYDVVLMDLQMPVMDGYTSTQEIRKYESLDRLPIIAMTADDMVGVKQQVLDAGMNDYITKPIDPQALFKILVRWIKPGHHGLAADYLETTDSRVKAPSFPCLQEIDVASALKRLAGNQALLSKLLIKFRENQSNIICDIRKAIKDGDINLAVRLAHTLKGVSGNIGAVNLQKVANELEYSIKQADQRILTSLLVAAEKALADVLASIATLDSLVEEPPSQNREEKAFDMTTVTAILRELKRLLENDDTQARRVLETLRQYMGTSMAQEEMERLTKRMGQFDFEGALEPLGNIAKRLNITLYDVKIEQTLAPMALVEAKTPCRQQESRQGDIDQMISFLERLNPFLEKKKPKPCKDIMAEMCNFSWPENVKAQLNELDQLVGKYKFKEAMIIVDKLIKTDKPR